MYQPKVVKTGNYISGIAKLVFQAGKFGVVFSSRVKDGKPINGDYAGKSFIVTEWPEYLDPEAASGNVVYAKLNSDGTKLYQVSPQDGVVEMLFTGFKAKEDEEPAPSTPNKDQWGNKYTTATAIFEITDGETWMVGMPQFLTVRPSLFIPDGEGNLTIQGLGNSKAVHGPKLNEFITNCGGWDQGAIPDKYLSNPLPLLQKRMLAARKKIKVTIQNGFVQSFWDTVTEDEFSEVPWIETDEQPFGEPEVTEVAMFEEDSDF